MKYKFAPLLFTLLENSTSTVEGRLSGVVHNESEIMEFLECDNDIVKIDSNFGHKKLEGYNDAPRERKSLRGRKKKPRVIKPRQHPGDGKCFNSQVSLTVLGEVIRPKALNPDKHSLKAIILNTGEEKFIKEYKIKVFRNGKYTVPGVLLENLSDIESPLKKICNYFQSLFLEKVEIVSLFSVMRNYKFRLAEGKIDIKKLQIYCTKHFQNLLNTRFTDIEEFLVNPVFEHFDINPNSIGWWEFLNSTEIEKNIKMNISMPDLGIHLNESKNVKNLFIDFDKLKLEITDIPLKKIYENIRGFVRIIQETYFINLNNNIIKAITKYLLINHLKKLEKVLVKSKDNLLSYIKYDPEKYPGFLIKVKTPISIKPDKRTTIKIFPSGKINIDGANNREEATFIYYWLNNLFHENSEFIYDINNIDLYNDSDSEFSSESESEN